MKTTAQPHDAGMERVRRVRAVWNWLPAFRAVAETEHIHEAARLLHVSASSLSRTIRLLEAEVGQALFERLGRSIRLTASGEELLSATRDSIRRIDDGLTDAIQRPLAGALYLMSPSPTTDVIVARALRLLGADEPRLVPHVHRFDAEQSTQRLLRGQLDVSLHEHPVTHRLLHGEHLGVLPCALYCAPGHPLATGAEASPEALAGHPFVARVMPSSGVALDGWPATLPRRVALHTSSVELALNACADGLLAVLPRVLAVGRALHEVEVPRALGERLVTEVHALRRPTLTPGPGRAELTLGALRRSLAAS